MEHVITIPPVVECYSWTESKGTTDEIRIVYAGSLFRKGRKVSDVHKIKDRLDSAVEAIAGLNKETFYSIFMVLCRKTV